MTEVDTCRKFVAPLLQKAGRDNAPHDATGRFDFILANGGMSSNHSGKGDIRNGPIEAEKMNSNSWKVHHNIQS